MLPDRTLLQGIGIMECQTFAPIVSPLITLGRKSIQGDDDGCDENDQCCDGAGPRKDYSETNKNLNVYEKSFISEYY
jgi:hypothetical protein